MIDRLAYGTVALLSVAVAVFALQVGMEEARLARFDTATDIDSFREFNSESPERAMSLRGDRALLYACDDVMSGRIADLVPVEALKDSIENCAGVARRIAHAAPTWALPQYILAVAAYYQEDDASATAGLRRSQDLGQYESWLAERRIGLALKLAENSANKGEVDEIITNDLSSAMESTLGRAFSAKIFVHHPEQREKISSMSDGLTAREKSEFLDRVRDEMQTVRNAGI